MEKTFREMAEELVGQMTVDELATQLKYDSPAIPRLGIPAYNWWNEVLHGVARAGTATVFPQAIALAAMFDDKFLKEIAETISTEARAKYNAQSADEDRGIYKGLTVWSPNVNIFRDKLSVFTTYYNTSNKDRSTNLELAAQKLPIKVKVVEKEAE